MNRRIILPVTLGCLLVLAGCTALPFQFGARPQASTAPIASPSAAPTLVSATLSVEPTSAATPLAPVTPSTGSRVLRVWVPPQFDPQANTPASRLLKARLEQYQAEHPSLTLEVRVKTLEGAGGMLEGLVAASAAAPQALPDLVLLPRPLLESAALKGLLFPYTGLTKLLDDPAWFDYARQMALIRGEAYGMPFAGDALALVYHPSHQASTPHNLETAISLGEVLLFPASDPQALFSLNLYLSMGQSLQDAQGKPYLEQVSLAQLLEYDRRLSLAGVMPTWLTQYSTDAMTWQAFLSEQGPSAVVWASGYLTQVISGTPDLALAPLPTPSGSPYTLASGWSWALAGQDPLQRASAAHLAEYLAEAEFMAGWTYAAGYLPPRADALQAWENADLRQMVEQISASAHLQPPADLLADIGPAVERAVVDVLLSRSDPLTAAEAALNQINQP